jgi:MoaA/NifB/PqqE/SkfB family radical SAM enzyme
MYKVTSRWPHQDSIKIEWNLGKRCNYDCSYCPSIIHDNSSPHTDIHVLTNVVDQLLEIGKPIRLSFTGGEPTIHPRFEELISYAKNQGIGWISVTTNGTRQPDWYEEQRVDQYVFSLHFEHDWRRALNNITILFRAVEECNIPTNIMVNVMAHHDYMREVKYAVGKLQHDRVPYVIRRIRWTEDDHNVFDDMRYNYNDLDWILEREATVKSNCVIDDDPVKMFHANDIIKLHLNKYQGWTCNAGLESLMINWDGNVHRATCRVGGSIGNIYSGTFTIPTAPITCTRDSCTCAADIPITKYAPIQEMSD